MRLRSMLKDRPDLSYQRIGTELGLSRQRIAQLAQRLGVNAKHRLHERRLASQPRMRVKDYRPAVQVVIRKIEREGMHVRPYNVRLRSESNLYRRSQKKVLVNGIVCAIQVHSVHRYHTTGVSYAHFKIRPASMQADVILFGIRDDDKAPVYIIPTKELREFANVYIPAGEDHDHKTGRKPRKDWNRYRNAWHLFGLPD